MPGKGSHRHTYWENPYAYAAGSDDGWEDQFLITVDMSDPTHMKEVGRWWYPGQHVAGGEEPKWLEKGFRYALHHAIPRGNRLYLGYWDAGLVILDNSNPASPNSSAIFSSTHWRAVILTRPCRCPAATFWSSRTRRRKRRTSTSSRNGSGSSTSPTNAIRG